MMRDRFRASILVMAAMIVPSAPGFAQSAPKAASAKARPAARFDPHDLTGVWTKSRGTVLTLSKDAPPMTPEGLAKFNLTKPSYGPRAVPAALGNDPSMGTCDPPGMPRSIFLEVSIYNMEFVQTPLKVIQFFEWAHDWRPIWTDGRELPKDPEPKWQGYSVGKWQGDTFVVDSLGFDADRTWLDHFGNPISDDARLEERYRRVDADTLEFTATLTDPKVYTKPWVGDKKILKLIPNGEIQELYCVPSEEQSFNKGIRDPAVGKK